MDDSAVFARCQQCDRIHLNQHIGRTGSAVPSAAKSLWVYRPPDIAGNMSWAGALTPSKLPLRAWESGPHLIHASVGPPDSVSQTASRSVQPFLEGWRS